jgi:hypothetical protein
MVRLKPGEVEIEVTNEVPDEGTVMYVDLADVKWVAEHDRDEPVGEGKWD